MASGLKVIAALGAIAAGAAAIFAFKKHKELENYDYEDLDEDFDDCCGCDECSDEAATEEDADVEVQLDAIEEPVEDVDKE